MNLGRFEKLFSFDVHCIQCGCDEKRSIVTISLDEVDRWLHATIDEALTYFAPILSEDHELREPGSTAIHGGAIESERITSAIAEPDTLRKAIEIRPGPKKCRMYLHAWQSLIYVAGEPVIDLRRRCGIPPQLHDDPSWHCQTSLDDSGADEPEVFT